MIAEQQELLPEEGLPVLGYFGAGSPTEVQGDRKHRKPVVQAQERVVLEHPAGEVALGLRLDLHMDENELRLSVASLEPGDDVGLAHLAFGNVGEDFLVDEAQGLEVEPGRGFGKEELEEILEQFFQNRFEELVLSHPAFLL